ncbi:hypothetical protein [Streptomyces albus]|uniref:hypothetical protein n=1 Tax=Streptomyces albus TaxID=1888 RepID=UPI0004CB2588|nr:hypothetical protein [Streptomyces albus]
MCQRVTCRTCGKFTYSGCGNHVDQVLAGVPAAKRCDCDSAAGRQAKTGGSGWKSLFGRG